MNKEISYFKKALVMLMAVMMVFTMMPSMAWADGESFNPKITLQPKSTEAEYDTIMK